MGLLLEACRDCVGAVSIEKIEEHAREHTRKQTQDSSRHLAAKKTKSYHRCLGCYESLESGLYHPQCSRKLFDSDIPPELNTTNDEIEPFAKEFLNERLTVTGVQRKLSLQIDGHENRRFSILGTLGGGYIMKPPSPDYEQMPENEDLTMHLARICGIKVAEHGLLPMRDGALAYVTKRFDRHRKNKIAVEDLCQLSELLTEQKYRISYEKAGEIIRKYSSVPGDDALRFFELVVFSYLVGNNDMHLKNFSLLTDNPTYVNLSPAYDLMSIRLLISINQDPEDVALPINGKKAKLRSIDFLALAKNLKIPEKVALRIIKHQCNMQAKMSAMIEKSFLNDERKNDLKALIGERVAVLIEGHVT